jgi:uncharacterized protein YndB with AHSA1/START domain
VPGGELVERETVLPVGLDEAWRLVTDPGELGHWLADDVDIELWHGGGVCAREADGSRREGRVEAVEAPCRLAFRWWSGGAGRVTLVEITLRAVAGGTRVRVVEGEPPRTEEPVGFARALVA